EDHEEVELDQVVERALAQHERCKGEQPQKGPQADGESHRDRRPPLDPRDCGSRCRQAPAPLGSTRRPPAWSTARRISTARNTTCPPSAKYCTLICAPTVCATPRTMPPTSVPQSEPMPPI